jgi:uncharacterized protein YbjT (DUF2867 family)
MVVMVVGANGQLGSACTRALLARGQQVLAAVRDVARSAELRALGAEEILLDVTNPEQRRRAVSGADVIIASANAVVPRAGDDPDLFDRGMADLMTEAVQAGVRRIVLPSVPSTSVDDRVQPMQAKRDIENALVNGSVEGWVLRLPPFMESWFALVGSSLPLRGERYATIGRPSPFLRRFRAVTGSLVEDRGIMLVPGPASHRHAFISVGDAARACVEAALSDRPAPSAPLEVAGPEVLSWAQVADLFSEVLGRRVRVVSTPAPVYAAATKLLAPVAAVPSRTMAMNQYMASAESPWPEAGGGLLDPTTMTTAREFLLSKAALDRQLETVP